MIISDSRLNFWSFVRNISNSRRLQCNLKYINLTYILTYNREAEALIKALSTLKVLDTLRIVWAGQSDSSRGKSDFDSSIAAGVLQNLSTYIE